MERRNIICSACKSNRVITDYESGEVICSNCGLVISDNIQESRAEAVLVLQLMQCMIRAGKLELQIL